MVRSIGYDSFQRLYSITEPETGTRTFSYFADGNIQTIDHGGAVTETRAYDGRDRVTTIVYSDGSPPVTQTWRHDGQPDTSSHDGVARSYRYDDGNLLTGESIAVEGTVYSLGYSYDAYQHIQALTYPDNTVVDYAPDAYGRPSRAGGYATGANYYSNDAIQSFTYGNGIAHNMTQDSRQLPRQVSDSGILSATYTYDNDGNPLAISDSVNAAHSVSMTYDPLDRLATANRSVG